MNPTAHEMTEQDPAVSQMLVVLDSDAAGTSSQELAQLRALGRDGLIRLVDSGTGPFSGPDEAKDADVDRELYALVYGLLHPDHDGGIATVSGTEKAMEVAVAVRDRADVFVSTDPRICERDRPFEQQAGMHLLSRLERWSSSCRSSPTPTDLEASARHRRAFLGLLGFGLRLLKSDQMRRHRQGLGEHLL